MRYWELIEALTPAEKSQNKAAKDMKARQKIADAQRKRSEASRSYQNQVQKAGDSPSKRSQANQTYQDKLRSAGDAQRAAQAKLGSP